MSHVGVGRRFLAVLVDGFVLAFVWGPFAEITRGPGYLSIGWRGRHALWPTLITIAYFLVLEGVAGATLGKFLLGLRVVHEDG